MIEILARPQRPTARRHFIRACLIAGLCAGASWGLSAGAPVWAAADDGGAQAGAMAGTGAEAGKADATLVLLTEKMSGPGVFQGDGVINYQGKKHDFQFTGMSIKGTSKFSNVEGSLNNLKQLADANGHYQVVHSTQEGCGANVTLRNDKGVEVVLRGADPEMSLCVKAAGIDVRLD